ncbi:DUF6188 family protein [uncultured Gimesia sp.]|uniref:DUF6188 family protein n=1 Tax=uncultured Gimesia sp. TaxID=1678688 RepID=UPI0030D9EC93|tara:strand:- start:103310 stop:103744 length:435 start_codon:yes stop_codon:yes gene_type:complete
MKKLCKRGRDIILPIGSDTLVSFCDTGLTGMIFESQDSEQSLILFEDELRIIDSDNSRIIHGTKPGKGFWHADLHRLDHLIGIQLKEAVARHDGCLILIFETGERLEIESTTGYEAWHFQYPRPDTRTVRHLISVHGTHGSLIY